MYDPLEKILLPTFKKQRNNAKYDDHYYYDLQKVT